MFSVTKYYKVWFLISAILVLAAVVLLMVWGLKPGIDFRGGTLAELEFQEKINPGEARQELLAMGFANVVVQPVTDQKVIIKTEPLDEQGNAKFKEALQTKFGTYQESRFESIGPIIGKELARKAYYQIILVGLGILFYIAYAFRKIRDFARQAKISAWHLGVATIIALLHDLLIPIGVFVVLGKFKNVEIDSLFITALLTIMGFSVHDTIVVFDRIRENFQKLPYKTLATIIDYSVNSTLARSINTSSTLIFVLIAMLLFGGETIFYFVLALLIGVVFGTYSSIFIASPLVYVWQSKKTK